MTQNIERDIDGGFFRIQRKWDAVCFSGLSEEQRNEALKDKSIDWIKSFCNILANTLCEVGDDFRYC